MWAGAVGDEVKFNWVQLASTWISPGICPHHMQSNEIPPSISNLANVSVRRPLSPSWYPLLPSSLPSTLRSPALMGRYPLVIGPRGTVWELQPLSRTAIPLRASCKVEVTNYFRSSFAPITCVPPLLCFGCCSVTSSQTGIHSKCVSSRVSGSISDFWLILPGGGGLFI